MRGLSLVKNLNDSDDEMQCTQSLTGKLLHYISLYVARYVAPHSE